mmetsp:Transcript_23108/g.41247  ORF Transcript_23108/g.41247 Transcript_23108/m.41247 type:complete len:385 (-) Transcript_23108:34-1188(-)
MWRVLQRSYSGASLYTWGNNPGSLGHKGDSMRTASNIRRVAAFEPGSIKQVAMGPTHSIVILQDNSVYTFGKNSYGQLGMRKEIDNVQEPTKLGSHTLHFKEASVSEFNTALLDDSGEVWASGYGGTSKSWFYQFFMSQAGGAIGTHSEDLFSLKSIGLSNLKSFAIGSYHAVAITKKDTLEVIGRGEYGTLGNGRTKGSSKLIEVPATQAAKKLGVLPVKAKACSFYSVVLMSDGSVIGWGRNDEGQLGIGSSPGLDMYETQNVPKKIDFGEVKIKDFEIGEHTAVFLSEDNKVYVTGRKLWWHPQELCIAPGKITSIFAGGRHAGYIVNETEVYSVGGMFGNSSLVENPELRIWRVKPLVFYDKRVLKIGGGYRNHYCLLAD